MPQAPAGTGPKLHLSSMPAERRMRYASDFLLRSAEFREQVLDEWSANWLAYQAWKEGRDDWKSNLRFPLEYSQVETAVSNLYQLFTANQPVVPFDPLYAKDAERADLVSRAAYQLVWVEAHGGTHLEDFLKDANLFGPGIFKITWGSRVVKVPILGEWQMGEEAQRIVVGYKDVRLEGPRLDTVTPWEYFPDPQGDDETTQELIGHRVWLTMRQLLARAKAGIYDAAAVGRFLSKKGHGEQGADLTGGNPREDVDAETGRSTDQGDSQENRTTLRFPVVEVWSDQDVTTLGEYGTDSYEEFRSAPNQAAHGTKPFVVEHWIRRKHDPIGFSFIRWVREISDAISSFHNQANDSRRLKIDARQVIREGVILPPDALLGGPGSNLRLPNPQTDIAPLEMGGDVRLAAEEEAALLMHMDRAGAQTDVQRGVSQGTAATATEVSEVATRAASRSFLIAARMYRALERLHVKGLALIQQNLRRETIVQMLGPAGMEWRTAGPNDLVGLYAPRARTTFDSTEKAQKQQRWIVLFRDAAQDPYFDPYELRKRYMLAMGETDLGNLLIDPKGKEEVPQELENIMLLKGIEMPVGPFDNDQVHLLGMQALVAADVLPDGSPNPARTDPAVMGAVAKHYREHAQALMFKQKQQAMQPRGAGGAGSAGGSRNGKDSKGGGRYDGANGSSPHGVNGRQHAQLTPGGGFGHPPGPGPADRGGGS